MIYAPVLITTLNRYEHLERLIKSLQKNKWAEFTELYIGVDFPPNEKYREGYEKVCDYLAKKITGFKKINIFYHKENLGAANNIEFLRKEVAKNYDRYISTEDDNEFSKNFLEYMDRGLIKFQKDKNIISICGYMPDIDWGLDPNGVLKIGCRFDAWGNGRWIEKDNQLFNELKLSYLEDLLCDFKRAWHIYRVSSLLFYVCVEAVILKRGPMYDEYGVFHPIDFSKGIYMIDREYFTIAPILSKVRNWGDDGSGLHCGNENVGKNQVIDEQENFDFDTVQIYDDSQEIQKKMRKYLEITCDSKYKLRVWLKPYRLKLKAIGLWLMYWTFNKFILKK